MTSQTFHGIPRDQILWNPTVDPEKCIGCGECLEVCANGVFEFSESTSQVNVKVPTNCVVLCDKCAKLCPVEAISFPDKDETQKLLVLMFQSRNKQKISPDEPSNSTSQIEIL